MVVDISRCQITHPDGVVDRARFVFNQGTAAVWIENKQERTATRVLYAEDATFSKSKNARFAHVLTLPGGTEWLILQATSGGCGTCGSKLKSFSLSTLLDPEVNSL